MDFQEIFGQFQDEQLQGLLWHMVSFVIWIVVILVILRLLSVFVNRTVKDNTLRYNVKKAVRFTGYALILLIGIAIFTDNVRYFTVAIGIISAGVAFALQEVILSIAGWVTILTVGMYKPGDRIELNDVKGDVIDIGITRTTMMELGSWISNDNYTGRIIHISNGAIFKGPVKNYSADFPFLWDEINIPISYGSDVELTRKAMLESARQVLGQYAEFAKEHWQVVVKKYLIEDAMVDPTLSIELTDNWINFNLRYVVDYAKRRSTKTQLFQELLQRFNEAGDKIQLASTTFDIVGFPEISIKNPGNLKG